MERITETAMLDEAEASAKASKDQEGVFLRYMDELDRTCGKILIAMVARKAPASNQQGKEYVERSWVMALHMLRQKRAHYDVLKELLMASGEIAMPKPPPTVVGVDAAVATGSVPG